MVPKLLTSPQGVSPVHPKGGHLGTAQDMDEDHGMLFPLPKKEMPKEHHSTPNSLPGEGALGSLGWAQGQAGLWEWVLLWLCAHRSDRLPWTFRIVSISDPQILL